MFDKSTFSPNQETRQSKIIKVIIFLLILWCGAYFYTNGGWNQCSRYDAIFSFVEHGTPDFLSFRIDHFIINPERALNTGDWAKYNGHYYSNKAPGCIFMGILVYFPLYYLERLFIHAPFPPRLDIFNAYVINLFASVFILALGAVFFYKILKKLGSSDHKALGFSLLLGLCTPLLPYATSLYAHTTATGFLIIGVYYMLEKRRGFLYLAGLFWGIAVLCDYLAVVPVIILTLYACWRLRRDCWFIILGGVIPLVFFMGYHWLCFDNPFCIATMYNNPIYLEEDKVGGVLSGISTYRMLLLVFGSKRGLLWCSPVLIFAFGALRKSVIFEKGQRGDIIRLSLGIILVLLVLNSSFNGWHSGWSISPRYIIITLPFWLILMNSVNYKGWRFPVAMMLAVYSCFNMLVASALTTEVPLDPCNPLWNEWYPKFFRGSFLTGACPLKLHFLHKDWPQIVRLSNFNLGSICGLDGLFSLIPLLIVGGIIVMPLRKIWIYHLQQFLSGIIPLFRDHTCQIWKEHRIACLTLIGFIFLYFLWPGNTSWINDEAQLIANAVKYSKNGEWGWQSLAGSVGISYGPCPLWFYQILLLFTHNPVAMVFIKVAIMLAGTGSAIVMIARRTQLKWKWGLLIFISSPYFYIYSRVLWDNVLLILFGMLSIAFVANFFCSGKFRDFIISVFFCYCCIYTHPMSVTLLGALLITVWLTEFRHFTASKFRFAVAGAISVLPLLPLAVQLISSSGLSSKNKLQTDFITALSGNLGGFKNLTSMGFAGYFIPELNKYSYLLSGILLLMTWIAFIVILIVAFCGLFYLMNNCVSKIKQHKELNARDKIFVLSVIVLLLHLMMSLVLVLYPFPHYSHVTMIAVFFIVWIGFELLSYNKYLKYIGVTFIAIEMIFLINLVVFINNNEGNRSIFYGATLSNQMAVAEKIGSVTDQIQQVSITSDVANVRRFPHALNTLLQLRKYYQPLPPKPKPGKIDLNIYHPEPYPSGKIDVRVVNPVKR